MLWVGWETGSLAERAVSGEREGASLTHTGGLLGTGHPFGDGLTSAALLELRLQWETG